jgi:hypothetical protein
VTGYDAEEVARIVREQAAFERLSGVTAKEAGVIAGFVGGRPDEAPPSAEDPDDEPVNDEAAGERSANNEAAGAANEPGDGEAYALLEEAYREVAGDDVAQASASAPSPLGRYAGGVTLQRIGITVHDRGTTGEYFPKSEAAVPANVILRFLGKS